MASVAGVELAVFGPVEPSAVRLWLAEHVRVRLGSDLAAVLFAAGRLSAVYGCALEDGRRIVIKAHRGNLNRGALKAALECQSHLYRSGYPCPQPLDGPATTHRVTATIDSYLTPGQPGDGHDPYVRQTMVGALATQIALLRQVSLGPALDPPAWARWRQGPWPTPHDPIFDFTRADPRWTWLDEFARTAAGDLTATRADCGPATIGHSDWTGLNVTVTSDGRSVAASYDWDSLTHDTEPVIAGLAAGSHTQGSPTGPAIPTSEEVTDFIDRYSATRTGPFTPTQRRAAGAAARWVLAYNARCHAALLPEAGDPAPGSTLEQLLRTRASYRSAALDN